MLVSYTVHCSEQRIVLHTVFEDSEPAEHTDVVFHGVVAYHFEGDTLPSIIFDVIETDVERLYAEYEFVFTLLRDHGWPPLRHEFEAELLDAKRANSFRGYLLASSYGMHGFVLAERMERFAVHL